MNAQQCSPIISLLIFSKLPSLKGDTSSFIYSSVVFNNCRKQVLWQRLCDAPSIVSSWDSAIAALPTAHLLCRRLAVAVCGGQAVIKHWSCSKDGVGGGSNRAAASCDWWSGLQLTITCQGKTARNYFVEPFCAFPKRPGWKRIKSVMKCTSCSFWENVNLNL